MFCKHKWSVLSDITTESKLEHAVSLKVDFKGADYSELERKHIQVVTCSECGKLMRFVEEI